MIANISPLSAELAARAEAGRPVTVGLAGAGQMGTDLVVQLTRMPGLRLGAVADMTGAAAVAAAVMAGLTRERIVEAGAAAAIDAAIERGRLAITSDLAALVAAGRIEVVIDATGNPNTGTGLALAAIAHGKHVVMLNVEADITIGRHLHAEARKAGVVYTGAAGDEPAAALELIGFAQSIGLDIVCAGKGKNNPLKFDAVPADYEAEARARNMNARMLVEFVDGSKTMVEMTAIANATGLVPDIPGMHGPAAIREDLASVLIPRADGGLLSKPGCVDFTTGKGVAPGVFCIVAADHPRLAERMIDLKVGAGPYFTLFRPHHLTSLEVPLTAARAVLHGTADMVPLERPVAEAVAVAKRDLAVGEVLGRIGETQYRGWAMTYSDARRAGTLPLGLAEGAKVVAPVRAGKPLTYQNCRPDDSLIVTQIRRRLDAADASFPAAAE
jgi:predicted homoserine dehydrogenase-like protein